MGVGVVTGGRNDYKGAGGNFWGCSEWHIFSLRWCLLLPAEKFKIGQVALLQ